MNYKKNCLFCQINQKGAKENVLLFQDKNFYCLLDIFPRAEGHCLLIFKKHYDDLAQVPARLTDLFFKKAIETAILVTQRLGAPAYFLKINNQVYLLDKADLGHVGHLHIHIVPRYSKKECPGKQSRVNVKQLLAVKRKILREN